MNKYVTFSLEISLETLLRLFLLRLVQYFYGCKRFFTIVSGHLTELKVEIMEFFINNLPGVFSWSFRLCFASFSISFSFSFSKIQNGEKILYFSYTNDAIFQQKCAVLTLIAPFYPSYYKKKTKFIIWTLFAVKKGTLHVEILTPYFFRNYISVEDFHTKFNTFNNNFLNS